MSSSLTTTLKSIVFISIHFEVTVLAHYASFILDPIFDDKSPCLKYCDKCRAATCLWECYAFIKLQHAFIYLFYREHFCAPRVVAVPLIQVINSIIANCLSSSGGFEGCMRPCCHGGRWQNMPALELYESILIPLLN